MIPYKQVHRNNHSKYNKKKSGVILYDPAQYKILIVQSRGNLWGFPKGTFEEGETFQQCAKRELYEETGIDIDINYLTNDVYINPKVIYYYLEVDSNDYPVEIQNIHGNDANGIGWINTNCMMDMIKTKRIKLNFQAKISIKKCFGINIS
tara:strand:- start:339 stop:788 length:450 start_codon:yes stop_codon:yes gene_type:complete